LCRIETGLGENNMVWSSVTERWEWYGEKMYGLGSEGVKLRGRPKTLKKNFSDEGLISLIKFN